MLFRFGHKQSREVSSMINKGTVSSLPVEDHGADKELSHSRKPQESPQTTERTGVVPTQGLS